MEVKKESLTNTLAELKERSMCLWNRLDALEQDCNVFQESVMGTLSDQITQVGTLLLHTSPSPLCWTKLHMHTTHHCSKQ